MNRESAVRTVELADGHLAYVEAGQGHAVVLLHGGALDHRMWRPQMTSFARDHRVVAVDARGHGWSSTPAAPYRHCDDLAVFLEALDLAPAALVGLSMGGGIAVDTTIAHPHLVDALVVSGTGTSAPDFEDPALLAVFREWAQAERDRDPEAWLRAFLRLVPGPRRSAADVDPAVTAAVSEMGRRTLEVHVGDRPPIPPTALPRARERAVEVHVPTLAVVGGADFHDHVRLARELVDTAGGTLAEVDGTGHYPNLEAPDRFDRAVRSFLDEVLEARSCRRPGRSEQSE